MRALVALVLLAALFSGCMERDFEPIQDAGWRTGYTFAYEVEGSMESKGRMEVTGPQSESRNLDERVDLPPTPGGQLRVVMEDFSADGASYYVVVANDFLVARFPSFDLEGEMVAADAPFEHVFAVNKKDLKFQYANFQGQSCSQCPAPRLTIVESWFGDEPPGPVPFPLVRGKHIPADPSEGSFLFGPPMSVTVGGMSTMMGPYGDVDVVRITHESVDTPPFLNAILDGSEAEGMTIHRSVFEYDVKRELFFAPSLHAVVEDRVVMQITVDVDMEYEGSRMVWKQTGKAEVILRLTSASLEVQPPGTLATLAEQLGKVPEPPTETPPTTPPSSEQPVPLSVKASTDRLEVGETISFTITPPTGASSDTVETVITDSNGKFVETLQGTSVIWSPAEPGSYLATVTAFDGKTLHIFEHPFAVDQTIHATLQCGVVGVQTCPNMEFASPPGWSSIEVELVRNGGPTSNLAQGALVVAMNGDEAAREALSGGQAKATFTDGNNALAAWSVTYDSDVDVNPAFRVTARLTYPVE